MSGLQGPGGAGDSELSAPSDPAAPAEPANPRATAMAATMAGSRPYDEDADRGDAALDDEQADHRGARGRPSNLALLLGAILVVVLVQLVVSWFVLGATTQLRDQYTTANGLQRCLIRAQLNANGASDPNAATAYHAAVTSCLNR